MNSADKIENVSDLNTIMWVNTKRWFQKETKSRFPFFKQDSLNYMCPLWKIFIPTSIEVEIT